MQPQPEPSSAEPSQDVEATEAPSESRQSASSRNFLQRLFRGRSEESEPQEEAEPVEPTSTRITLTQEELDRRVQAETDRREHKRMEAANAERRRRLRDEDPWAYAEEERTAEQRAGVDSQVTNMFAQISSEFDRNSVDPVVLALPERERQRILALEGAGLGLEGRKLIVSEGLKALEKHWKEEGAKDAETKLRRNPAFRKQVLGEFRRGMTEPEFIGSGTPSAAESNVSNILRSRLSSNPNNSI